MNCNKKLSTQHRMEAFMKRTLINSIIIVVIFSFGNVLGITQDILLFLITSIIVLTLIYTIIMIAIIILANVEYNDIKKSYHYLQALNEESYKYRLSSENKNKVEEYDATIKMAGNGIILHIDDYVSYKIYKRIIPKFIYNHEKKRLYKIREEIIRLLRME